MLIAEDHETVRQGLCALLADRPDIEVVGEASNGRAAVDRVCALKPDIAVLDLSMPEMSGLAQLAGSKITDSGEGNGRRQRFQLA